MTGRDFGAGVGNFLQVWQMMQERQRQTQAEAENNRRWQQQFGLQEAQVYAPESTETEQARQALGMPAGTRLLRQDQTAGLNRLATTQADQLRGWGLKPGPMATDIASANQFRPEARQLFETLGDTDLARRLSMLKVAEAERTAGLRRTAQVPGPNGQMLDIDAGDYFARTTPQAQMPRPAEATVPVTLPNGQTIQVPASAGLPYVMPRAAAPERRVPVAQVNEERRGRGLGPLYTALPDIPESAYVQLLVADDKDQRRILEQLEKDETNRRAYGAAGFPVPDAPTGTAWWMRQPAPQAPAAAPGILDRLGQFASGLGEQFKENYLPGPDGTTATGPVAPMPVALPAGVQPLPPGRDVSGPPAGPPPPGMRQPGGPPAPPAPPAGGIDPRVTNHPRVRALMASNAPVEDVVRVMGEVEREVTRGAREENRAAAAAKRQAFSEWATRKRLQLAQEAGARAERAAARADKTGKGSGNADVDMVTAWLGKHAEKLPVATFTDKDAQKVTAVPYAPSTRKQVTYNGTPYLVKPSGEATLDWAKRLMARVETAQLALGSSERVGRALGEAQLQPETSAYVAFQRTNRNRAAAVRALAAVPVPEEVEAAIRSVGPTVTPKARGYLRGGNAPASMTAEERRDALRNVARGYMVDAAANGASGRDFVDYVLTQLRPHLE